MATKEQIAANRKNAKKSTGPKSIPGKAKTKLNGLKHGLRAHQVVLPTEDPAAFQAHLDAWFDDWQPPTMARAQLVEDAAVAAWRKKRCVRVESQRLSQRVNETLARWHAKEQEAIDASVADLVKQPAQALRTLRSTRAGIVRLIQMWSAIAEACTPDGWDDVNAHHFQLLRLCGHFPAEPAVIGLRDASWRLYLRNAPDDMIDDDDPEPWDDATAESIAEQIRALTRQQIESYAPLHDELPDPTPWRHRQAEAEAFAPHRDDALLLHYEAQLSREFHRSLADLTRLTQSEADVVEEAETVDSPTEANLSEVDGALEVEDDSSEGSSAVEAAEGRPEEAETAIGEAVGPIAGTASGPEPALIRS